MNSNFTLDSLPFLFISLKEGALNRIRFRACDALHHGVQGRAPGGGAWGRGHLSKQRGQIPPGEEHSQC